MPVPTKTHSQTYNLKDDKDFIDLGLTDAYIGGFKMDRDSVEVRKNKKHWENELKRRMKGKVIPKKYWEFPELEKGHIHKHCSTCFILDCPRRNNLNENDLEDDSCSFQDCKWGCGARFHWCKMSEHNMICPNYVDVSDL